MNDKLQPNIGNDNFKNWLKTLDPTTRLDELKRIANSQMASGVRGSLIRASLAQLSQRCQVMLIRLTEEEIRHHTRRKPLKRLHEDHHSRKEMNAERGHKEVTTSNSYSETSLTNSAQGQKAATLKNTVSSGKRNSYERKCQELFGDEPEDSTDPTAGNMNYMSTIVNVNIYNSPGHNESSSIVQRHSENAMTNLGAGDSLPKRLRIDVSIPSHHEYDNCSSHGIDKDNTPEKPHKNKSKKKSKHSKSKHNKEKLNKCGVTNNSKMTKPSSPNPKIATGSPDEDPSIKELWSILGMESPTTRSESIKANKLHPVEVDPVETVTLHRAPSMELDVEHESNLENHHTSREDNAREYIQSDVSNEPVLPDVEPVCKIAETFSLAEVNDDVPDLFALATKSSNSLNTTSDSKACKEVNTTNNNTRGNGNNITIISLSDDDSNSGSSEKNLVPTVTERDRVGTIRVKSLGSLMEQSHSAPVDFASKTPNALEDTHQANKTDPKESVENRFKNTYTFYFDELVTSKIPKLGELLHLAISDKVRRNERIKRAEQLSSDDLIKEEKQRADKDFNDMMRIRGAEFAPLFEIILKKFDAGSKMTLFIALFCKLLSHAESIDPTNKNDILDARTVIYEMLKVHSFNGKDILDLLKEETFKENVVKVNSMIKNCTDDGSNKSVKPTSNPLNQSTSSTNLKEKVNTQPLLDSAIRNNNGITSEMSSGQLRQNLLMPGIPSIQSTNITDPKSSNAPISNNQFMLGSLNVQCNDTSGHIQSVNSQAVTVREAQNNQAIVNSIQNNPTRNSQISALQNALSMGNLTQTVSRTPNQAINNQNSLKNQLLRSVLNSNPVHLSALQEELRRKEQAYKSHQVRSGQATVNKVQQNTADKYGRSIPVLQNRVAQDQSGQTSRLTTAINNAGTNVQINSANGNQVANAQKLNVQSSTASPQVIGIPQGILLNGSLIQVPNSMVIQSNNIMTPLSYSMIPTMSTTSQVVSGIVTPAQPTPSLQTFNSPNVVKLSPSTMSNARNTSTNQHSHSSEQQPAINNARTVQNQSARMLESSGAGNNSDLNVRTNNAVASHAVVNRVATGGSLNSMNNPGNKYRPIIIRDVSTTSQPMVVGVDPSTLINIARKPNPSQKLHIVDSANKYIATVSDIRHRQKTQPLTRTANDSQHGAINSSNNLQNQQAPRIIRVTAETTLQPLANLINAANSETTFQNPSGSVTISPVVSSASRQQPTTSPTSGQTARDQARPGVEPVAVATQPTSLAPEGTEDQDAISPTSSHCHPFVARMPISGKMKMFFGK